MSEHPRDLPARRQIAESLVGPINEQGYCRCPGAELHSNQSGPQRPDRPGRDCRVYLEPSGQNPRGVPTIKCVHVSCQGQIDEANHKLRSQIAKHEVLKAKDEGYSLGKPSGGGGSRRRSAQEIAAEMAEKKRAALAERARQSMPGIISKFPWDRASMWETSDPLPESEREQAQAILRFYHESDVVWVGGLYDSIANDEVEHTEPSRVAKVRGCFRTAGEWQKAEHLPGPPAHERGPRICPSVFEPGTCSRSQETVRARRFLVIEHDNLGMDEQAALLRWMHESGKLRLRAIVFTGGKSLHGWVEWPGAQEAKELETVLLGMGYDAKSFAPAQPYPLPGALHRKTGQPAELWFLQCGKQSTGEQE